ncbi:response regulator [Desulfovibrio aminophilus]|nr:response regulator [Desulfovibrio aminophilus]MCM0756681.1 response regulator [Desulfovibrio aminophilus]
MRALIAEDEFLSRKILLSYLTTLFDVDIVVNGKEAVDAFRMAREEGRPYDLILMDIMMPEVDGMQALEIIRGEEREGKTRRPVRVIMTTALDDPKVVIRSFHEGEASGYIVKPVIKEKLYAELEKLGLLGR